MSKRCNETSPSCTGELGVSTVWLGQRMKKIFGPVIDQVTGIPTSLYSFRLENWTVEPPKGVEVILHQSMARYRDHNNCYNYILKGFIPNQIKLELSTLVYPKCGYFGETNPVWYLRTTEQHDQPNSRTDIYRLEWDTRDNRSAVVYDNAMVAGGDYVKKLSRTVISMFGNLSYKLGNPVPIINSIGNDIEEELLLVPENKTETDPKVKNNQFSRFSQVLNLVNPALLTGFSLWRPYTPEEMISIANIFSTNPASKVGYVHGRRILVTPEWDKQRNFSLRYSAPDGKPCDDTAREYYLPLKVDRQTIGYLPALELPASPNKVMVYDNLNEYNHYKILKQLAEAS